jgi:hypothetical protein
MSMRKKLDGVALILFCIETKKIFVIRELQSKEGIKQAGELSVPAETRNPGENVSQVIERLYQEEVGPIGSSVALLLRREVCSFPWIDSSRIYAPVTTFVDVVEKEFDGEPGDFSDVEYLGWMTAEELLGCTLRPGVRSTLEIFQNNSQCIF